MNYIDAEPLELDETQPEPFALYQQQQTYPGQQSFPVTVSQHLAASNPPLVHSNYTSQYEMIPHNYGVNAHTNFLNYSPSGLQPAHYALDRWATTTAPYAAGNIVQPPPSYAPTQRFDQQSFYGPRTNYANSYNSNFVEQQHSATPSTNLSHNAYASFQDSGFGGLDQDTSNNGFGTATSSNAAFPFPMAPVGQQCPQSFDHQSSTPQESSSFLQVPSPLTPSPFRCNHCGHHSRTQSEYKKHMARHEKPHKCPVLSCDYASATANDLERHTRSKHFLSSLDGRPATAHVCSLEPCKSQDRKFPRLDNFRNHLRKRHNLAEEVVEQLVRSSRQSVQNARSRGRRGSVSFGGAAATPENGIAWPCSETNTQELTRNTGGIVWQYPTRTVSYPPQTLEINGAPDLLFAGPYAPQNESPIDTNFFDNPVGQSPFRRSLPQLQIPTTPSNFSQQADTPMTSRYGSEAGSQYSMGNIEHHRLALESARYEVTLKSPREIPSGAPSRPFTRPKPRRLHPNGGFNRACRTCQKWKDSPCQLKKHLDSLLGMFFCTSGCEVTFGTKDRWRRHENSAHWKVEGWACNLEKAGENCPYHSYHLHSFKTHLKTCHPGYVAEHGEGVGSFRVIDQEFPTSFWCGFCTYSLEMTGNTIERVNGRLTHIEDHLKGRKDWQHGTAETWTREPEAGCRTVKPLDCRQHRTSSAMRHRSKSAPDAASMQQAANSIAPAIRISVIPAQEQARPALPPQSSEPTLQVASTRSRSSSSPHPQPRPRRRTTTRTCCQCNEFYFDASTYELCVNCGHQLEGCGQCTTKRMHVPQGNEERYG